MCNLDSWIFCNETGKSQWKIRGIWDCIIKNFRLKTSPIRHNYNVIRTQGDDVKSAYSNLFLLWKIWWIKVFRLSQSERLNFWPHPFCALFWFLLKTHPAIFNKILMEIFKIENCAVSCKRSQVRGASFLYSCFVFGILIASE